MFVHSRKSYPTHGLRRWVCAVACVVVLLSPNAHAAQFAFKQYEADTGTSIRQVIGSSNVPLDRTYAQLDDAALAQLREAFPKLGPADEPPFPEPPLRSLISAGSNLHNPTRKARPTTRYDRETTEANRNCLMSPAFHPRHARAR